MIRILLFTFALISSALSYAAEPTKEQADALYEKEDYEAAARIYEGLLRHNGPSVNIYYNLGNCYYKLDNIPYSILNYERALLLNPGDDDVRTNIAMARGKTEDKVTPASEMFFVTWWRNLINSCPVTTWTWMALLSFILFAAGILLYSFTSILWAQKTGVYGAVAMLLLTIIANCAAYSQNYQIEHRNSAIIITPSVVVKSTPSERSTDLFIIHEGSKVEIIDNSMKGWRQVKFEEGKQGWVPVNSMEVI